jgi:hypothetical protein
MHSGCDLHHCIAPPRTSHEAGVWGGGGTEMATTFTTRACFFTGHGRETLTVIVNLDDSIQVWDSIAGQYTRRHALTPAAQRRILREARTLSAR